MKKSLLLSCLTLLLYTIQTFAQGDTTSSTEIVPTEKFVSPYTTRFWVDGPIIAGGVGLNLLGYSLIQNKKDLTPQQLASKTIDKIPFFDRSNAGWYSKQWDNISYYPFQGSFALPVITALINKNQRQNFGQVMVLYVETMAIIGGIYTTAAGVFHRPRPFVYGDDAPLDLRMDAKSQRSFMAGHTASTTAAMIFWAKVFSDMNPDSKLRPYVWGVAIATSASMAYMRYRAGMHFPSDNLVGLGFGAAVGYLVPHLHKTKVLGNKISVLPYGGPNSGLTLLVKLDGRPVRSLKDLK